MLDSEITFTDANVTFIGNEASVGGAIYNVLDSAIIFTGVNVAFSENTAGTEGGAIYNGLDSEITFTGGNTVFSENTANDFGGAISNIWYTVMDFTDTNVIFIGNTAGAEGGAIYNTLNAEITFTDANVTFSGNTAGAEGGAIYNTEDSEITFSGSEVIFSGNQAGLHGGAIYNNNSVIDFASSVVSFINNSAGIGGAIFSDNNNMSFSGGEVKFEGNQAGSLGGALYITESAVSFDTNGGEVLFSGNTANGKPNDVYMDTNAILNISGSNAIRFEGGILSEASATGIEINKSGTGAMYLGGVNEVWGDFNITGGDIIMLGDATYQGKALELPVGSTLDMHNDSINTIVVTGNFASPTDLKMDIFSGSTGNDKIFADTALIDGNIAINAGVGTYNNKEFDLIITNASGNLSGTFASSLINDTNLSYQLVYYDDMIVKLIVNGVDTTDLRGLSPLTYNQSETAKAFDQISVNPGDWGIILTQMRDKQNSGTDAEIREIKRFLAETSGYFLANVIRNMAADSPNNEVYDKIRNHSEEHKTNSGLWVQLKGGVERFKEDENSPKDYRDISKGVMFGFDRFLADKLWDGDIMWGVYGRINKDNVEQGKHRAEGNKNGLGVYGGYIRDYWELKGMLLGSYDKFSTERMTYEGDAAKADINAVTVSADVEAALKIGLIKNKNYFIDLKPYIGMELQNTKYEGFKERGAGKYNLETEAGNYLRSAGRVGLGLDYEKGRWIWYGNVEGKYMIEGRKPEIRSEFEETGIEFYSRGSEEGRMQVGAGLGGAVRLGENWKVFINGKYYAAERYENMYGNAGVRYMFGGMRVSKEGKEAMSEGELRAKEAEEMAEEALKKAKEARVKVEEAKELEKELSRPYDEIAKEEIYKLKIRKAREAIGRAGEGVKKAEEAIKKSEEVSNKVEEARKQAEKAREEGYGVRRGEKEELEKVETAAERALMKAEEAREIALRAEEEAKGLLLKLEEERTRNEEKERMRQEELIKEEISDEDLARQKKEAEERRKRPMLKTYTLTANFRTNEYFLTEEFKEKLREIAKELGEYEYRKIKIEGHTDSTGSKELNKRLSRQRARSVYEELVKLGIEEEKMSFAGFADTMPVESNRTVKGRAANRRTEMFIE
jgi:predicted outer membrane repeat protein